MNMQRFFHSNEPSGHLNSFAFESMYRILFKMLTTFLLVERNWLTESMVEFKSETGNWLSKQLVWFFSAAERALKSLFIIYCDWKTDLHQKIRRIHAFYAKWWMSNIKIRQESSECELKTLSIFYLLCSNTKTIKEHRNDEQNVSSYRASERLEIDLVNFLRKLTS